MSNDGHATKAQGFQTSLEILSQPGCWNDSLRALQQSGKLQELVQRFSELEEWIFVGCGSSHYVAMCAASTMAEFTGLRARAVVASELLLYPAQLPPGKKTVVVLISRSGRTSEVLRVAEQLAKRGITSLGISCAPHQPLEQLVTAAIVLPAADEQSTVMTRSFTSMLLALQALAAAAGTRTDFGLAQKNVAASAVTLLDALPNRLQEFVCARSFDDYVFLGQGPLYGIACESALKLTEMSLSYAQSFHTLEFRHGPKSIVSAATLIGFLLSQTAYQEELSLLQEVKRLGGTTLVVANRADAQARAAADLLVELETDGLEAARVPLYLLPGQLLGLYTGLKKGLDPDVPRHLSRVVILDDTPSREETRHATL